MIEQTTLDTFAGHLGVKTQAGKDFLRYALENVLLADKRQQDGLNVASFGAFGCLARMDEGFARLKSFYMGKRRKKVNDAIRQEFCELSNDAILALMVEDGKFTKA